MRYDGSMKPWTDRQGRFSALRTLAYVIAITPALVIAYWFFTGALQPLSVKNALHLVGDWAVRFLVFTLALTPLMRLFNYTKLALIRRISGVTAFAYAITHFILYIVMSKFDLNFVASEIIHRFYLTIGFVVLIGLCLLAGTSFDSAIRKLGGNWKRLHQIAYGLAVLGLFHYFLQSKIDVSAATLVAGLFLLAMTVRVMLRQRMTLSPLTMMGAAVVGCVLTALVEYAWYGLATGVNPNRVLLANFMVSAGLRPAVKVLLAGIGFSVAAYLRQMQTAAKPRLRSS